VQNDTALGLQSSGTATSPQSFTTTRTTVQAGALLELQGGVAPLNGGVPAGIEVWNEHLVLNGGGQQIAVAGTSGTFTLTLFGLTTSALPFDVSPAVLEGAINGLVSGQGGLAKVTQSGNIYTVVFGGALAGSAVPLMLGTTVSGNMSLTVTGANAPLVNLADDNLWRDRISLGANTTIDVSPSSRLTLFGAVDDGVVPGIPPVSNPLIHDYQLNNSFADALGGPPVSPQGGSRWSSIWRR
jgi:hypothetical protein